MKAILAKLKGGLVWVVVGLAVVLLAVFGLWRRAARLAAETKRDLADSQARERAAQESAARTEALAVEKDAADITHEKAVESATIKHETMLAAARDDEYDAIAAGSDADDVVALAHKMRAEGKIR